MSELKIDDIEIEKANKVELLLMLEELANWDDLEGSHYYADKILRQMLILKGCDNYFIQCYDKIGKWYA